VDLVDATLVALAEVRNQGRIFNLDQDFTIYRIHGRTASTSSP
jgi:predicted nucleic acid-binding protein